MAQKKFGANPRHNVPEARAEQLASARPIPVPREENPQTLWKKLAAIGKTIENRMTWNICPRIGKNPA